MVYHKKVRANFAILMVVMVLLPLGGVYPPPRGMVVRSGWEENGANLSMEKYSSLRFPVPDKENLGELRREVVLSKASAVEKESANPSDGELFVVTLVTGDKVLVSIQGDKLGVAVEPVESRREFVIFTRGESVYVVPKDVNLTVFDIELFNVHILHEYSSTSRDTIPLIVKIRMGGDLTRVEKLAVLSKFVEDFNNALGEEVPSTMLAIVDSVVLKVPVEDLPRVYRELSSSKVVEKVTLDRMYEVKAFADILPQLYESVQLVGAPVLWRLGINGSDYKIAILDTGIDPNHPDFFAGSESKIVSMASFVDYDYDGIPDEPPIDRHGHGTHCAGVAAGVGGYLEIIKGVAPGAKLLVGKVLSDEGKGYTSWIIRGIEWAVTNGADIISMSLGGAATTSYDPLVAAVDRAARQGVVVVIAAGNSGPGYFTVTSPGVSSTVITVGAVNKALDIAPFSGRGPTPNATLKPDVVAPGVSIASSRAWGTYLGYPASVHHVHASGTSMATPHVAGLAALVLQLLDRAGILPEVMSALGINKAMLVKDVIVSTAKDLDLDPYTQGAGLANVDRIASLVDEGRLLIIHPARADIVGLGDEVKGIKLYIYNPTDDSANVELTYELRPWPGIDRDVTYDIYLVPSASFTIPPHSYRDVVALIDFSAIPAGYHAVLLRVLRDGEEVGKAVIGISKPITLTVSTTIQGKAECSVINLIGFTPKLGGVSLSGSDWGWTARGCGNITIYPLLPEAVYLVGIYSWTYPYAYFTSVKTDASQTFYNLSIDFTSIKPTKVTSKDMTGYFTSSYGGEMTIVTPQNVTVERFGLYVGWIISLYDYSGVLYDLRYYTESDVISDFGGYTILLKPSHFAIKAEVQRSYNYPDLSKPLWVVYRVYGDAPRDEVLVIEPVFGNYTFDHIYSALSDKPTTSRGGMFFYGNTVPIDGVRFLLVSPPFNVKYIVDATTVVKAIALNMVNIPALDGKDTLTIVARQSVGIPIGGGYLYAPLASPLAGNTIWLYSNLMKGSDGYNFTVGQGSAHMYRATIARSHTISSKYYPITSSILYINKVPIGWTKTSGTRIDLYGFNWNYTWLGTVSLEASLKLHNYNLSAMRGAYARATAIFNVVNYSTLKYINAYGYGVGLRDILVVGDYDYLSNYLPLNGLAVMLMYVNRPAQTTMGLASLSVKLKKGVYVVGLPVEMCNPYVDYYVCYVLLDATSILEKAPPGPMDLAVDISYIDSVTEDVVVYESYIDSAIHVGTPIYTLYPIVYIRPNGEIETSPPGIPVPIIRDGDHYYLVSDFAGSIVIERNNTVLDGRGHKLYQPKELTVYQNGIVFSRISDITVTSIAIEGFAVYGIRGENSSGITIANSTIRGNLQGGIYIKSSFDIAIRNCSIELNGGFGIEMYHSQRITISDGIFTGNNPSAIHLVHTGDINISKNFCTDHMLNCVWIYFSSNIIMANNLFVNSAGIYIDRSSNSTIVNNILNGNERGYFGISIAKTHFSRIENNSISNFMGDGIYLDGSYEITVRGNTIRNLHEGFGISASESSFNEIVENVVENNRGGILIGWNSTNNRVKGNTVRNNTWRGIAVWWYSEGVDVINNTVINTMNGYGLQIFASNRVKLIGNSVVDVSYSSIIVTNSTGVEVKRNTISGGDVGVDVELSQNVDIEGNRVYGSSNAGIVVSGSTGVVIRDNAVSYCGIGMRLNIRNGLIVGNYVANNRLGVYVMNPLNNTIVYFNSFVNNSQQVELGENVGYITWDNGSCGNYWSDHACIDKNMDGICDNPYVIRNPDNVDRYPLAQPHWTYPAPPVPLPPVTMFRGVIALVRGLDGSIYYGTLVNDAVVWRSLYGYTPDTPSATYYSGRMYVFVRGGDDVVWMGFVDLVTFEFSGWMPLPGSTPSRPSVTSTPYGVVVAVRGMDNGIYLGLLNGSGFYGWYSIPGGTDDSPAVGFDGDVLHLIVKGLDGGLYHTTLDPKTLTQLSPWERMPGQTDAPVEIASSKGLIVLTVKGMDDGIWLNVYNATTKAWSVWHRVPGGATDTTPTAIVVDTEVWVFVKGYNSNEIWMIRGTYGPWSWTAWILLPGETNRPIEVIHTT